ncbi:MAG: precorrin-2 C(20)-methyltransferase [Gammaproteobacteria bacterium]|nr:precorrin-2 C(20)-methyltransferase [Gammaproteobacteria bacterium]MDH5727885.1 precorrin-2 C(20)-methyltransferase [Gammaproteobacteria bacterium]
MNGSLVAVGLGPGDPELVTLKAVKAIAAAQHVFVIGTEERSRALETAKTYINSNAQTHLFAMPMLKQRTLAKQIYKEMADAIHALLQQNKHCVFLCEGDPMFYGSFIHLLDALNMDLPLSIIPGISSIHSAAAASLTPLVTLNETLTVIPATTDISLIEHHFESKNTIVILKAGPRIAELKQIIIKHKLQQGFTYVENCSHPEQRIINDITQLPDTALPYFSLLIIKAN